MDDSSKETSQSTLHPFKSMKKDFADEEAVIERMAKARGLSTQEFREMAHAAKPKFLEQSSPPLTTQDTIFFGGEYDTPDAHAEIRSVGGADYEEIEGAKVKHRETGIISQRVKITKGVDEEGRDLTGQVGWIHKRPRPKQKLNPSQGSI